MYSYATKTSLSTSSITCSDRTFVGLLKIAASLAGLRVHRRVVLEDFVPALDSMRFNEVSLDLSIPMMGLLVPDDRRHRAHLADDGLGTFRERAKSRVGAGDSMSPQTVGIVGFPS